MSLVREKDGRRLHIKSKLMGESLVGREFLDSLVPVPQERLFPELNILKIGGQSICDRGARGLPGVDGVFTFKDIPENVYATAGHPFSLDPNHQDVADRRLLTDYVRYEGDEIAVVVDRRVGPRRTSRDRPAAPMPI